MLASGGATGASRMDGKGASGVGAAVCSVELESEASMPPYKPPGFLAGADIVVKIGSVDVEGSR